MLPQTSIKMHVGHLLGHVGVRMKPRRTPDRTHPVIVERRGAECNAATVYHRSQARCPWPKWEVLLARVV